jgi:hypothetical protein
MRTESARQDNTRVGRGRKFTLTTARGAKQKPAEEHLTDEQGAPLPEKQEAALLSLLSHKTLKEAALAAGVSLPTLWRYLRDPIFSLRYHEARRELVECAMVRLQNDSEHAACVLRDVADDTQAPAGARVTAARTIIELSVRSVELGDLQQRIASLEDYVTKKAEQDALARGRGADEDEDEEG